jgi:hypothetical protein
MARTVHVYSDHLSAVNVALFEWLRHSPNHCTLNIELQSEFQEQRQLVWSNAPVIGYCVISVWRLPAPSLPHLCFVPFVFVSLSSSVNLHIFCVMYCLEPAKANLETGENINDVAVSDWDQSKSQKNNTDDGHTPTHLLSSCSSSTLGEDILAPRMETEVVFSKQAQKRLMHRHDFHYLLNWKQG